MADSLHKTFVDVIKANSVDSQYEIRAYYHGELMCPNPREKYLMTRSYEQMRAEYDLLHCNEVTEEDIMKVYMASQLMPFPYLAFGISLIPLTFIIVMGLLTWMRT